MFVSERVLECVLEDIRTNTHTKAHTHNKLFNTRTYAHTNGPSVASQTNFPEYSNARAKWDGGGKEEYVWVDLLRFPGSSSRF